jgi:hypothetical protein
MALVTVMRPDVQEAEAPALSLAPPPPADRPLVLTLIDNGKPKARELLQAIASELGALVPLASVEIVRKEAAAKLLPEAEATAIAERSDIVLAGLGDCGACSACSVDDVVEMQRRGVPAVVVISDVFQGLAASFAASRGLATCPTAVVPHPVSSKSDEHIAGLARRVVGTVHEQLIGSRVPAAVAG